MKITNFVLKISICSILLKNLKFQENSFEIQDSISKEQNPQLKNLLKDPSLQQVLLKKLTQQNTFQELFQNKMNDDKERKPGLQKPNPQTLQRTQNRRIFTTAQPDTIIDPMNILLQNIRYYTGLKDLESDFRIIYYKEIMPENEQIKFPKKYIICFYMKIKGLIKYLGIEFSVLKDKENPIFIEQSLLMTNLQKLQFILDIKEIDFKFFAFYQNLFLRLLNNNSFDNYQKSFQNQNFDLNESDDITPIKLQDPNFLIKKVQYFLNKNFKQGATFVSFWQSERSILFQFSEDFEKMGFLCIKLLPSLVNSNIFLIQEFFFSKNKENAAAICQIQIKTETSVSAQNQIILQRIDISTNEDIEPYITFKKNDFKNSLTNFPIIKSLQNKDTFNDTKQVQNDPFDIINIKSLASNNQKNIEGISLIQNPQQ